MERQTDKATEITLLWTAAQPSVMAFIRSVTPQLADAEDILRETALQIVNHFDQYDNRGLNDEGRIRQLDRRLARRGTEFLGSRAAQRLDQGVARACGSIRGPDPYALEPPGVGIGSSPTFFAIPTDHE